MAFEEKTIEQLVDPLVDLSSKWLYDKVTAFILKKITGVFSPFWLKITMWLVDWVFKNFINPAIEDMEAEGFCLMRQADRRKRVKIFLEAPDENFDESVDDFFDVPSHRVR